MQELWIPDVHCHVDLLDEPERAIEAALEAGVCPLLAVGMQQASSERLLELRQQYPEKLLVAIGLHPSEIPALDATEVQAELDFVESALARADALGEVGLDFRDAADEMQRDRQREALTLQLQWAARERKPVSAHCRRAEHEIVDRLAEFVEGTGLGANLHWFTHSEKMARICGERRIFISPGPSILHSDPQATVAAMVEAAYLLIETDSPVEFEGEPAQPEWARQVAARLAEIRGMSFEDLATLLQDNFRRYLGSKS